MMEYVRKLQKCEDGFSLIEAAIALLIVSLIFVPMIVIYNNERAEHVRGVNVGNLTRIQTAINDFVVNEDRYPIPADMFLSPLDADYGVEHAGPIAGCAAWPGTPAGVCRTPGITGQVLIGAVPFASLGLPPDMAHDYWGHKILYAVTETQTGLYVQNGGNITGQAIDSTDTIVAFSGTPLDMVLVTHGETAAGAYSREGVAVFPCIGPTVFRDTENCNMDGTFLVYDNTDDITIDAITGFNESTKATSLAVNAEFYDDYTAQQARVPADLWLENTTDNDFVLTLANRVGIGTENPDARVHVIGDVRADNLRTDRVCNDTGTNCFNPIIISGAEDYMDCSRNTLAGAEPVLRISNSRVQCASPIDVSGTVIDGDTFEFPAAHFTRTTCASGDLITGFAAGAPVCVTP